MGLPKGLQAGSTKEVAWQGLRRPAQQADSPVARQETQGHCHSDQAPEGLCVSRALGHRSALTDSGTPISWESPSSASLHPAQAGLS